MNKENQSEHQLRVAEFMSKAGQTLPSKPTVLDEKTRILRAKLLLEETMETIQCGLGITVSIAKLVEQIDIHDDRSTILEWNVMPAAYRHRSPYKFECTASMDIVETVDGCCDVSVVNTGLLLAMGVPDKPVLEEVDKNNLAKFGPGSYKSPDGKYIKPPNHPRPKLKEVLEGLGYTDGSKEEVK